MCAGIALTERLIGGAFLSEWMGTCSNLAPQPRAQETGCRGRQSRREFSLHQDLNFPQQEGEIGVRADGDLHEGMSVEGPLYLPLPGRMLSAHVLHRSFEWVSPLTGAGGWVGMKLTRAGICHPSCRPEWQSPPSHTESETQSELCEPWRGLASVSAATEARGQL